jgi:hypothetical protein
MFKTRSIKITPIHFLYVIKIKLSKLSMNTMWHVSLHVKFHIYASNSLSNNG